MTSDGVPKFSSISLDAIIISSWIRSAAAGSINLKSAILPIVTIKYPIAMHKKYAINASLKDII